MRWLPLISLVCLTCLLAACDHSEITREWSPDDHQYPDNAPASMRPSGNSAPSASPAQTLWRLHCASCHGISGRGDGAGRPPGLEVRDLTDPALQSSLSDDDINNVIQNGKNQMPPNPNINEAGRRILIEHVRSLRRQ